MYECSGHPKLVSAAKPLHADSTLFVWTSLGQLGLMPSDGHHLQQSEQRAWRRDHHCRMAYASSSGSRAAAAANTASEGMNSTTISDARAN